MRFSVFPYLRPVGRHMRVSNLILFRTTYAKWKRNEFFSLFREIMCPFCGIPCFYVSVIFATVWQNSPSHSSTINTICWSDLSSFWGLVAAGVVETHHPGVTEGQLEDLEVGIALLQGHALPQPGHIINHQSSSGKGLGFLRKSRKFGHTQNVHFERQVETSKKFSCLLHRQLANIFTKTVPASHCKQMGFEIKLNL